MGQEQFYGTNNREKYPEGKLDTCKKCVSMHVDNFKPDTFTWILQECDVPFIPNEWNGLMSTYAKDPSKLTGMTILGRYLSKMKLKQYKEYRWKDNDFIQELEDAKIEQTMKRQGYSASEITVAQHQNRIAVGDDIIATYLENVENEQVPIEDYFAQQSEGEDIDIDLTDEEKTYLRLKWGKSYKPEEWVKLEQLYEEMTSSYDIQGAGHIDTLKLVCKTSLKANQLLDIGDVDGAQKMIRMYDGLMKSGNFTAAQNKAETGEFVDSVGELISICERQGYIERYYIESPNDKVDLTIQDMQRYTRTLIEEETNLSNMIEQALKQNQKEDEEAENNNELDIIDEDDLNIEDLEKTLKDDDFNDFNDFLEEQSDLDFETFEAFRKDE